MGKRRKEKSKQLEDLLAKNELLDENLLKLQSESIRQQENHL